MDPIRADVRSGHASHRPGSCFGKAAQSNSYPALETAPAIRKAPENGGGTVFLAASVALLRTKHWRPLRFLRRKGPKSN
jgi:hypothetical protein